MDNLQTAPPGATQIRSPLGDSEHEALSSQLSIRSSSNARDGGSYPPYKPDWCNLEVLHKNTLTPRSTFHIYDNEADAVARDISKSKTQSLSGIWKFKLEKYPVEPAPEFYAQKYDTSQWDDIEVPGMWQLQGHGQGPQYTNFDYPWPVDPPNVPLDDNETGYYVRKFQVPEKFKGHQLRIRFEGVDSAFHVWINGKFVGYSQGARNPSEWDVTSLLGFSEENIIAVRVYQRCDGSYIEDQDQWWLSGIFRDVNLLAFPETHVKDFRVNTDFDSHCRDATLSVTVVVNKNASVMVKLLDSNFKTVERLVRKTEMTAKPQYHQAIIQMTVKTPHKWTSETPYLYHVVISLEDDNVIVQRVGFRKVEIRDGLLRVNNMPIVFRGVNRHEHHPTRGRAVPFDFMRKDLLLMKTHNINAIRTCHQINDPRMYDLADELGFWIIDEADLECHGFGVVGGNASWYTSDNPAWEEAYLDRAQQLVSRDKNHPSLIIWSLGNESFFGRNHIAMYNLIKKEDKTRPVHYEADWQANTVDLYSKMYTSVDDIINFATSSDKWEKPLILCEFAHAMGNGPGGLSEYVEAFYKYPRLQGGFVWEWANHGLWKEEEGKKGYFAYGGDFGDDPHDNHFCMDGLLDSNHEPGAGIATYKKAIEPVQVLETSTPQKILIINRYDHTTLDHLTCEWYIVYNPNGQKILEKEAREDLESVSAPQKHQISIPSGIKPGHTGALFINCLDLDILNKIPTESYLEISFKLKESTAWANAGHEVAWGQVPIKQATKTVMPQVMGIERNRCPTISNTGNFLQVAGTTDVWTFDTVRGALMSWTRTDDRETELLKGYLTMDFYRAVTDNEVGNEGREWKDRRLHQTKAHMKSFKYAVGRSKDSVVITVEQRIAPPVLSWSVDTTTTYTIHDTGIAINVKGRPGGNYLPRTFGRIGLTLPIVSDFKNVDWFGRGPGPGYPDMKVSQKFGNHNLSIDDLFVNYEFPQEGGNRIDVRWVSFSGDASSSNENMAKKAINLKASFGAQEECSFNASHYVTDDVDKAQHAYELEGKKREETYVRLDWKTAGIGTGSCGPKTTAKYECHAEPFEFDVLLESY